MTPCSLAGIYRRLKGTNYLHLQCMADFGDEMTPGLSAPPRSPMFHTYASVVRMSAHGLTFDNVETVKLTGYRLGNQVSSCGSNKDLSFRPCL